MTIPLGFALAKFVCEGSSVPTGAIFTLGLNLEGSSNTPTQVAQDIWTLWDGAVGGIQMSSTCNIVAVEVKFGPDATGPSGEYRSPITGTSGASASPNVAWLVKKVTAVGGRAGRGRFFIPGVPEAAVGPSGDMDDTAQGELNSALSDFYADLSLSDYSPVLLHQPGSPISAPSLITEFVVDSTAATQRRRMRR